jgi:hypothetical protein
MLKSLFQKTETVTGAVVETVKTLIGPSVAEAEAKWVLAQEDVDRALAVYDENPSPENYTTLQSARTALQAVEEALASARRRELRTAEKAKAALIRTELRRKAELIKLVRDAVADFDTALLGLTPAAQASDGGHRKSTRFGRHAHYGCVHCCALRGSFCGER